MIRTIHNKPCKLLRLKITPTDYEFFLQTMGSYATVCVKRKFKSETIIISDSENKREELTNLPDAATYPFDIMICNKLKIKIS